MQSQKDFAEYSATWWW